MRRHWTILTFALACAVPTWAGVPCTDADGDSFSPETGCPGPRDCNDGDPGTFPGAAEVCNGIDDDCNGLLDDDPSCAFECDATASDIFGIEASTAAPGEIAWNGTDVAFAWRDQRGGQSDIFFQRVGLDLVAIGPEQRLTDDDGITGTPSIAWTGGHYGMAWTEGITPNETVFFARVDIDGNLLAAPTPISTAPARVDEVTIAWSGSSYAVAWDELVAGTFRVCVRALDTNGAPLAAPNCLSAGIDPVIVGNGEGFGFLFANGGLRFQLLDAAGAVVGGQTHIPISMIGAGHLAWNGNGYAVFTGDFVKLDPTGAILLTQELDFLGGNQRLVYDGSGYAVSATYFDGDTTLIRFRRFNADGVPLAPPVFLTTPSDFADSSRLVWTGFEYGVAYREFLGNEAFRFLLVSCCPTDGDSDGFDNCRDCDDANADVYPGAPQRCQGGNDDCNDPNWPFPPTPIDADGDGLRLCIEDCDDRNALCTTDCTDADGDGACVTADCDDADPANSPEFDEVCDGGDNDCDALVDEAANGEDADADGIAGLCDNCPAEANPTQADEDNDDIGDACDACPGDPVNDPDADGVCAIIDNCTAIANPAQGDIDADGLGDMCDACPFDAANDVDGDGLCGDVDNCPGFRNNDQLDSDGDGSGDACDNCRAAPNADQADIDGDGVGNACDNCVGDANGIPVFDFTDGVQGWSSESLGEANTWHVDDQICSGASLGSAMLLSNGNAGPTCTADSSHEHSRVLSPPITLPEGESRLMFSARSLDEAGPCIAGEGRDRHDVGITTDGGTTMTVLNDCFALMDGRLTRADYDFDLGPWAGQTIQVGFSYDTDGTEVGFVFAVDDVAVVSNGAVGQADADGDGSGDVCDNCADLANPAQDDSDRDGLGAACDNCPSVANIAQTDTDGDFEGDLCDADDGRIIVLLPARDRIEWADESGFDGQWNVYRGALTRLRDGGDYSQQPGGDPLAAQFCGLGTPDLNDATTPAPNEVAFYLTTGLVGGVETSLGEDSDGAPRPNANPCTSPE